VFTILGTETAVEVRGCGRQSVGANPCHVEDARVHGFSGARRQQCAATSMVQLTIITKTKQKAAT
jgi:hypothetical protein